MPTLRHGFKTECEQMAMEIRGELGLHSMAPLSPPSLALHLCIPVRPIAELVSFGAGADDIARVRDSLSALTVFHGTFKAIFVNTAHPPGRLANSLTHELSHVLLEHTPEIAVVDGNRAWNATQEAEAEWLAGTILVPREGALRFLKDGGSLTQGATYFGVSGALFSWRVNQTGIAKQLKLSA